MALVGIDGRLLRVNRALCEIVGYSEEDLLEKTFQDITHPDDLEADLEYFRRMLAGEIRTYQMEKRYLHAEGHEVWGLLNGSLVQDEKDEPLYFIGQIQDITERKRAEERLEHQAFHDSLTGLPNRSLFMDRLKQALERTRRRSGPKKVAVLFMDLDNFKDVNDSLGHEVGDLLLVDVGERLRGCLRPEDTLARFGGDEFTVMVDGVENPADAVRVAGRIVEAFREPFVLEGRELFIKPSMGIALGTAQSKTSSDELLREADTAMYQAKDEGLGYRVFEPVMHEQAMGRLKMENELQRAIEDEEFMVHYQPIIDLRSDEQVWGMEALVRWQHPRAGVAGPRRVRTGRRGK
jgi:diguanylate cyclase (GGDEF)-like protein/PAS domain S-box-containing protein